MYVTCSSCLFHVSRQSVFVTCVCVLASLTYVLHLFSNESVLHRQSEFFVHIISRTDRFARNCFENVYSVLCHIISCHVMSCHVVSRHVTSRHVTSYHIVSCIVSVHVLLYMCNFVHVFNRLSVLCLCYVYVTNVLFSCALANRAAEFESQ